MSEKYEYNSTYAFSENKITSHIELEGLEGYYFNIGNAIKDALHIPENETAGHFLKEEAKVLTKAETYENAIGVLGGVTGAALVGMMTGGIGEGAVLRTTINISVRTEATTAEISTASSTIRQNAAKGAAFEQKVGSDLVQAGDTKIAPQITIKADNGVKTRVDFISQNNSGQIALTEAKSSSTAPLTGNQAAAYPSIAQSGGVIVGKGKPGYLGGTVIPPTQVNIVRPTVAVADATYVRPPIILPIKKN